jgi:transcriptional regulator with XRE-family HTH domain
VTGTELRRLRKAAGFNLRQFGELLGVTEAAVSRWETGDRDIDDRTEKHIRLLEACNWTNPTQTAPRPLSA